MTFIHTQHLHTLLFKIDFTCISHTNIFIIYAIYERVSFWIPIETNNYAILNYMRRDYVRISAFLSPHETVDMRAWIYDSCVSSCYRYFRPCIYDALVYAMTMQNNNITSDATYFKSQIAPPTQPTNEPVSKYDTGHTQQMLDIAPNTTFEENI